MSALPLSAAMSVGLRRHETRLLEQRREHDRRPGVHLAVRAPQVAEDRLHALEIVGDHLEDVAVVARNVVALQHARVLLHFAHARLVTDVIAAAVAHGNKGCDGQADLGAVELDAVPEDVACLLESLDALHHGGAGQMHFIGDGLVALAPVLGENAEDFAIGAVELVFGRHLGWSPCRLSYYPSSPTTGKERIISITGSVLTEYPVSHDK